LVKSESPVEKSMVTRMISLKTHTHEVSGNDPILRAYSYLHKSVTVYFIEYDHDIVMLSYRYESGRINCA